MEKVMYFANFNIVFGNDEPMLSHFLDIIYPAFTNPDLFRGRKDSLPKFYFNNVNIIETNDGKLVMVGNFVKQTEYKVITVSDGSGDIIEKRTNVPTSPYSRFVVFLENHRMVLVKNENRSPDVRSFQNTVEAIIGQYTKITNKKIKEAKSGPALPVANVNIIDMILPDNIDQTFMDINKINYLRLKFVPLNNDITPQALSNVLRASIHDVNSPAARLEYVSPKSKEGTRELLVDSAEAGLAKVELLAKDNEGGVIRIRDDDRYSSITTIDLKDVVDENDDQEILHAARRRRSINIVSPANMEIYQKFYERIRQFLNL